MKSVWPVFFLEYMCSGERERETLLQKQGRRREPTPENCPLTFTLTYTVAQIPKDAHTHN